MNKFYFISYVLVSFGSCSINRAPSDRMLNARSSYESDKPLDVEFVEAENNILPTRAPAVTADIWVHPNEMASGDYFLGGWIRSVIKEPHWSELKNLEKAFRAVTKPDSKPRKETSISKSKF